MGAVWRGDHASHDEQRGNGMSSGPRSESGVGAWAGRRAEHSRRASGLLEPPVERGWADKADSRPPLRGARWLGGDWYVWHAPDGPRARAATALGCMQAGAEKLGVIEASYASAIIGVLSPVSSHCLFSHRDFAVMRPKPQSAND